VSKLREHWVETNQVVVYRKHELEQCLQDSFRWDYQLKDVDAWLERMESRVDHVGQAEDQTKEQKVSGADRTTFLFSLW
jgi:hypothetical protein